MKPVLFAFVAATLCVAVPSTRAQVPNPGSEGRIQLKWLEDYKEVLNRAKNEKKPVLIDFTTDWCGWSKKMDRETFAKKDVQKELRDFLLIRINPETNDDNKKLGEDYSISSYPTLVVVNYNGEETGRREGFMEEKDMLKFLKEQLPLYKGNPLG
jgi:thiol:disulfide interchange protein